MFLHNRNFDIIQDENWREIVQQQYRCGQDAVERDDFRDAAIHLGSVIEGLMGSFIELLIQSGSIPKPTAGNGKPLDVRTARITDLTSILESAKTRDQEYLELIAFSKKTRNIIHTGRESRDGSFVGEADIRLVVACLDKLIESIESNSRTAGRPGLDSLEDRAKKTSRDLKSLPFLSSSQSKGPIWTLTNPLECLEALVAMMSFGVSLFENGHKQVGLKRMMSTEFTHQSYDKFFHGEEPKQRRLKILLSEYKDLLQRYISVDQMFDWSIYGTVSSSSCNRATSAFVREMFFSHEQELSQVGADTFVNHVSLVLLGAVRDKQIYHWHYGMLLFGDEMFHRPYSGVLISDEHVLALLDACYWGPIERKAFGAGSFDDTAVLQDDETKLSKLIDIIEKGV